MNRLKLVDFNPAQETMINGALAALSKAGYDTSSFQELIKVDMPAGFRAMTLDGGAALGEDAFESQDWLNHVLEEELLHLIQKAQGLAGVFGSDTALELELDVNDSRKFPQPAS